MKKLSTDEINQAVVKIKDKYKKILTEFSRPKIMLTSFEDRYINALKTNQDITVFILAEIEAVDEIYTREAEKKKSTGETKLNDQSKTGNRMTVADKVFEENRKKIDKYEKVSIANDADEELERLIGAVRGLMITYWPALNFIFNNSSYSSEKSGLKNYYNKLITYFDFKELAPIAKPYISALSRSPKDYKSIEHEHKFIFKETAFLLNEIYTYLTGILSNNSINFGTHKIEPELNDKLNEFKKNFNGLTYRQCIEKTSEYLFNIIDDFRIKDIRRNV